MSRTQISVPLALAIALALGVLTTGCARDAQPVTAPGDAPGSAAVAHGNAQGHVGPGADAHGADEHDAGHARAVADAAGVDVPVPPGHTPWTPDAPLVEGMARVRIALAGLEAGADTATVAARATDVGAAVEYMFANCSLPTDPDIALHAILARLMAGTQALRADPADLAPAADMRAAVANYEVLFDDPDD